jgi:hypothetical protein
MLVKGNKGITEVYFRDFAAVEPKIEKVRSAYREKLKDAKPKEREELNTKVELWCEQHFGQNRFNKDWFALFGTDESNVPNSTSRWDEWLNAKPLIYRKLYYDPTVVAACLKSEEE